jgi:hypothetical protein
LINQKVFCLPGLWTITEHENGTIVIHHKPWNTEKIKKKKTPAKSANIPFSLNMVIPQCTLPQFCQFICLISCNLSTNLHKCHDCFALFWHFQ